MNNDPTPHVVAAAKEILLSIKDGDDELEDLPTIIGSLERFESGLQENLRCALADAKTMKARLIVLESVAATAYQVWCSVPATRNDSDPMVVKHAVALNAMRDALKLAIPIEERKP